MPVYEYRCNNCGQKATLYVREFSKISVPTCPRCGSGNMTRIFSSFAIQKTDRGIYEDVLSDEQLVRGMEQNDPRALAEWSKRMGDVTGESEPQYKEVMERLEAGENYEEAISNIEEPE